VIASVLLLAALQGTAVLQAPPDPVYPFAVGEHLEYSAKLGFLRLGSGVIEIAGIDTIRGVPSFKFAFSLTGGNGSGKSGTRSFPIPASTGRKAFRSPSPRQPIRWTTRRSSTSSGPYLWKSERPTSSITTSARKRTR
jgi:hypothetical protein